jgi:hypothetical protein
MLKEKSRHHVTRRFARREETAETEAKKSAPLPPFLSCSDTSTLEDLFYYEDGIAMEAPR